MVVAGAGLRVQGKRSTADRVRPAVLDSKMMHFVVAA